MTLAGLGGGLAALGHAPFSLPWVALVGLVVLVFAVANAGSAKTAASTAWVGGTLYFGITMHWIVAPFQVDAATFGWMAPFALVGLAGGLALFWTLAGAVAGSAATQPARALIFAVALALAELARAYVFTGLPWALIGGIWINEPSAMWLAWIGPHGLGTLTLLFPAGFVWAVARGTLISAMPVALGPIALTLAGLAAPAPPAIPQGAPVIRVVQPNAPQHLKWDPDWIAVFFQRLIDATAADGPEGRRPDLILWPETATSSTLTPGSPPVQRITRAARGTPVLLGHNRWQGDEVFNAVSLLQDGQTLGLYDKSHLVPFGEYVPLGDLLATWGVRGLAARDGAGYASGPGPKILSVPGLGDALPLICYEAIFPQFGRALSTDAVVMLHLTNDAWFGIFAGPQQHLDLARMRAVERGVPVIRAANTGISAVIDTSGQILNALPLNEAGFFDTPLPPRIAPTLYARTGDLPVLGLLCIALGLAFRRREHAR